MFDTSTVFLTVEFRLNCAEDIMQNMPICITVFVSKACFMTKVLQMHHVPHESHALELLFQVGPTNRSSSEPSLNNTASMVIVLVDKPQGAHHQS